MAGEPINILQSDARGTYDVVFVYTITTPKQLKGTNIIVTPSSTLPPFASDVLDTTLIQGLDAGTHAFEIFRYEKASDVNNQQQIDQLKQQFASRETLYNQKYNAEYQYLGVRLARSVQPPPPPAASRPASEMEEDRFPPRRQRVRDDEEED